MPDGPSVSSRPKPARPFLLGRNHASQWVVQDQRGMWGGVFVDRSAALKFAMSENGRPQAVVMMPYPFELTISALSEGLVSETIEPRAAAPRAA
jgi:hypothetical protein